MCEEIYIIIVNLASLDGIVRGSVRVDSFPDAGMCWYAGLGCVRVGYAVVGLGML